MLECKFVKATVNMDAIYFCRHIVRFHNGHRMRYGLHAFNNNNEHTCSVTQMDKVI